MKKKGYCSKLVNIPFPPMKTKIIISALLLLNGISFIAQSQVYFSKRYNIGSESVWNYSDGIIENDSIYVISFESEGFNFPNLRRIGFLFLDTIGNQILSPKIY